MDRLTSLWWAFAGCDAVHIKTGINTPTPLSSISILRRTDGAGFVFLGESLHVTPQHAPIRSGKGQDERIKKTSGAVSISVLQ